MFFKKSYLPELVSFAKIGAIGFVIDGGLLVILYHYFHFGHYESRAVSFGMAVAVTWLLNRSYTFKGYENQNKIKEYFFYFAVQVIGAIINLCVYALLINVSALMAELPIIPLSIGAAVAFIFNYLASRSWVFTSDKI